MKEQNKTPEKELSNKEITSLSDAEFKTHDQDAHRNDLSMGLGLKSTIWKNRTK